MKTEKNKKLRGTVLFTVVAVMALLIIFLTGTLALATASSNRAHKSYSSSQASYTAKSAISGFTAAMTKNKNIANTVIALGQGSNPSVIHPEVKISNSAGDVDKTVGLVGYWDPTTGVWQDNKITVEKINSTGSDQYGFNKKDGKWEKVELVKITATARVGKEESTVTAYIKKRPNSTTQSNPTIPTGIKGFNTIGDAGFRNGGRFTGGLGIGLKSNVKNTYILHNACELDTTLTFINGDIVGGTSTFAIDVHEPKSGERPVSETIIKGNFHIGNGQDPSNPLVQLNYTMNKDYTQKQIPYLYIDGLMTFDSQCTLVSPVDANHKSPYNIFVGTIKADKNDYRMEAGDLYMMDEYDGTSKYLDAYVGNYWDQALQQNVGPRADVLKGDNYYGGSGNSWLYEWTNSVYNKTKAQFESYGGNMYCNGRLHLAHVVINGDVRVTNNCYIGDDVVIKGDLVVQGNLEVSAQLGHEPKIKRIFCNNPGSYKGKSGAVEGETFKVVKNTLHIPDELKAYGSNLSELQGYEVTFPKRNLFVWDPSQHKDASGDMMLLNGDKANDPYVLYYWWKPEYSPGIRLYKNETEIKYVYPGDEFDATDYTDLGTVEEVISALLASESFLRDDVTNYVIQNFIDVDSVKYSSELPKEDGRAKTWYYTLPKYIGDDTSGAPVFRETSEKTDFAKGYYIPENNPEHKFITTLPYYTLVTYDEKETDIVVTDSTTIYSNLEPHNIVDENYVRAAATPANTDQVVDNSNVFKYDAYPNKPAYPVNMTRDAIYYDTTNRTKIVRTLDEVREDMNLNDLTKAYPSDVDPAYKNDAESNIEWDGNDSTKRNTSITQSCTIKNDVDNVQITINPKGKTIWVILDNVTMKNNADIIVDLEVEDPNNPNNKIKAGKVCFLVKGTLFLANQNSIVNKEVTTNNCTFDYTKDWGMEFYGQKEDNDVSPKIPASLIHMTNLSTITGAFRCPYTDFVCQQMGKYTVNYTDEYGVDWSKKDKGQGRGQDLTENKPPIIGNALFRDVRQNVGGQDVGMNNFGMYYTQCGQSGSGTGVGAGTQPIESATGEIFDIMYFSGV